MKEAFLKYKHLWLILVTWIVFGNIFQPFAYAFVILSLIIFYAKERYVELFIGFLFILILSDYVVHGETDPTKFAKDLKGIYLVVIAMVIWRKRKLLLLWNPIFNPLIPFFFLSFISLIWAINLTIGLQKTISFILLYLAIPILFLNLYNSKRKEFIYTIVTFYTLIFGIGILFNFIYPSAIVYVQGRFSGLLGNPNGLGELILHFFLFFYIIKNYKLVKISKKQHLLIYTLIIISLILSASRNAIISITLFLFLVRVFKIHFIMGILVLFITIYLYETVTFDPVAFIEATGAEDFFRANTIESGSGRFIAWDFAWKEIQNYYFMGGGFGQDEQIMRPNYWWLEKLGHNGGVHNSYLSMWMDTGLIGVILYFSAMITLIWRASKITNLAWPFFLTILFNINYESWLVASLNPFSIIFLCSLTMLVMKSSFTDSEEDDLIATHK